MAAAQGHSGPFDSDRQMVAVRSGPEASVLRENCNRVATSYFASSFPPFRRSLSLIPHASIISFPFGCLPASAPPSFPPSLPLSRYPPVPRSHKIRGRMGTDRVSLPFFMPSSPPPLPLSHRIFAGIFWGTSMENVPISVGVTQARHRRHQLTA